MEPPIERLSFEDSDSTQDTSSYTSQRSSHREQSDVEKFHLLGEDNESIHRDSWRSPWAWSTRILSAATILNIILFLISITILSSSRGAKRMSDQDYWRATSAYSPVLDRFNIPKLSRTTNGTFWDTDPPSIWRVRTGADADAAWNSIGSNIQPIIISSDDVRKLGKDPSVAVKAPPELNLGPDAYIAGMDVFHHLHCLDKLRREISYKHYHEAEEGPYPGSELHEAHINHCMDVLAQALKCSGSVDMVTFNWVEGHRMPQPDFNNRKVCRDFEALRGWAVENGVDKQALELLGHPPPDAVIVPEFRPGHHGLG